MLVFVGMVIQTAVSLNGIMFSTYFLVNTNSFVLFPYWLWQYLWYHDLWSLWTLSELCFLLFPVIWSLILRGLLHVKNILTPLYVQLGSIAIDILMVFDLVFRENAITISLVPSFQFWNLVSGALSSLVLYGIGLGLLFVLILKGVIWIHNRVPKRSPRVQQLRTLLGEAVPEIRNLRKMTLLTLKVLIITFVGLFILIGIAFLTDWKLLDWTLIFSLAVCEVPIGVFLSVLLGERRGQPYRTIERFDAMVKYGHLQILELDNWFSADYPRLRYYVVNTRTKNAFWVDNALYELAKAGIIRWRSFDSAGKLDDFLSRNQIVLNKKYGSLEDLGLSTGAQLV